MDARRADNCLTPMPPEIDVSDAHDSPRMRLQIARERSGKTPQEVASLAGLNLPSYFDCENHDDLVDVISIRELRNLCGALRIKPRDLFADKADLESGQIHREQIARSISLHLESRGIALSDFEDRFGFRVGNALKDPDQILEWSVDWLRAVCTEIGIDWLAALN